MKKLIYIPLLFVMQSAIAGTGQGMIKQIESGPLYGNKIFFTMEGTVSDQPSCRDNANYHFVFDTSEPGGKELLSLILSAKASRWPVVVSGTGQCAKYNGVEDLRWLRLL